MSMDHGLESVPVQPPRPPRRNRHFNRRVGVGLAGALAGGVAIAVTAILAVTSAGPASAATTLAQGAELHGKYFGYSLGSQRLSNTTLTNVAGSQFDMLTPENEMKWDAIEPNQGQFNFVAADQLVNFATSHNQRIRGHNLVWHSQLPAWVSQLPTNQVRAAMEAHINGEVNHFKGKLFAWDVVNEPFNEDGSFRSDPFLTAFGSGAAYIADALTTAHNADGAARLYINDFNIEANNTAKSNAMFTLAQQLLAMGAPLNGIGFESHFIQGQVPSSLQANMQRFANLGLDVAVTELDVRMPVNNPNLGGQANDFVAVVNACLAISRCPGITQWNVGDADSWVPGTFSGMGLATLFDNNYQPKPAFTAVINALTAGTTTPPPPPTTTGPPPTTTPPPPPPTTTGPPPPPGGCSITLVTQTTWQTGYVIQPSRVTNTGTSTITGWTVRVTLPAGHAITGFWNATESVSGQTVTFHGVSFNSTLAPGASGEFGFQASRPNGNTALPTATCTFP